MLNMLTIRTYIKRLPTYLKHEPMFNNLFANFQWQNFDFLWTNMEGI